MEKQRVYHGNRNSIHLDTPKAFPHILILLSSQTRVKTGNVISLEMGLSFNSTSFRRLRLSQFRHNVAKVIH